MPADRWVETGEGWPHRQREEEGLGHERLAQGDDQAWRLLRLSMDSWKTRVDLDTRCADICEDKYNEDLY